MGTLSRGGLSFVFELPRSQSKVMNYEICNIHKIENKIDSINATVAALFSAQAVQCRGEAKITVQFLPLLTLPDSEGLRAASEVLKPSKAPYRCLSCPPFH